MFILDYATEWVDCYFFNFKSFWVFSLPVYSLAVINYHPLGDLGGLAAAKIEIQVVSDNFIPYRLLKVGELDRK